MMLAFLLGCVLACLFAMLIAMRATHAIETNQPTPHHYAIPAEPSPLKTSSLVSHRSYVSKPL